MSKEFRSGATMKDWKGCRGFERHVAQHVTNAMPPYLIANEAKSPFPFSATNSGSMKHMTLEFQKDDLEFLLPNGLDASPTMDAEGNFVSPTAGQHTTPRTRTSSSAYTPSSDVRATCWEVLTLQLGRFARQYLEQHGPKSLTDKLLQSQARLILYDSDDEWEQTAADNPEWLNLFKKAHGIDTSIPVNTTPYTDVLEDLGIRPNAQMDSSFNLNNFVCVSQPSFNTATRASAFECSLSGSLAISQGARAASSSYSLPGLTASSTTSDTSHLLATSFAGLQANPVEEQDCIGAGGLCIGEDGEFSLTATSGAYNRSSPSSGLASTKGLDSLMTPITEMPCTTSVDSTLGDFGFPAWDQMGDGFDLPLSTAEMSSGIPVSSAEFDSAAWADSEMTFNLDMDLDMDLGMGGS